MVNKTNFVGNHAAGAGGAFFASGRELHTNFDCESQLPMDVQDAVTASSMRSGPKSKLF
jgi:hypothetical protein